MKQYRFRDAEFMSAREKELVLKSWVRFLKHGVRYEDFSHRLYEHLHLHCQFIAHYNRAGFYQTYFSNGEDMVRFLSQFDKREESRSVEYGGWSWQEGAYEDLAKAMVEEASAYLPELLEQAQAKQRKADLEEAERLLAKHGREFPS